MATPKNQISKTEQNESRQSNVAKQIFVFFWGCDKEKEDLPRRAAGAGGLGRRHLDKGSSSFFVLLSILCPLSSSHVHPGP